MSAFCVTTVADLVEYLQTCDPTAVVVLGPEYPVICFPGDLTMRPGSFSAAYAVLADLLNARRKAMRREDSG